MKIQNLLNRPKERLALTPHPILGKKTDSEATVYVYEEIGGWGLNALDFSKEISALDVDTIHLRINSPGGDVFAARAMQTTLKQHKAKVIAHIDGFAASAASYLMLAADEIEIADGGFIMIHNAATGIDIYGYFMADDLLNLMVEIDKEVDLLTKVDESILNDFVKKTGKTIDQFRQWMKDTTWFTAQEALEAGLVDRVYDGEKVENKWDFSGYQNCPEPLKNITKQEQEPKADEIQPKPAVDTSALLRRLELELQY